MCYNCDRSSHYSGQGNLPDCRKNDTHSLQLDYYFAYTTSVQKDLINPNWILLNSFSNVSSVMNPYLL